MKKGVDDYMDGWIMFTWIKGQMVKRWMDGWLDGCEDDRCRNQK